MENLSSVCSCVQRVALHPTGNPFPIEALPLLQQLVMATYRIELVMAVCSPHPFMCNNQVD